MTTYLRAVLVHDGYNGATQVLHLCEAEGGKVFGVWTGGWFTYADLAPLQGWYGV